MCARIDPFSHLHLDSSSHYASRLILFIYNTSSLFECKYNQRPTFNLTSLRSNAIWVIALQKDLSVLSPECFDAICFSKACWTASLQSMNLRNIRNPWGVVKIQKIYWNAKLAESRASNPKIHDRPEKKKKVRIGVCIVKYVLYSHKT